MLTLKLTSQIGVPQPTIYKWIREWNRRGELLETLKEKKSWTTKEVKRLIMDKFAVEYSNVQISRILRGFGMRLQKPYTLLVIGFLDESPPQTEANTVRIWVWSVPFLTQDYTAL